MALVSVTVLGAPYCCVVVVAVVVAVEVAALRGVDVAVMGGAIVTGADVALVMSEVEVATMIGAERKFAGQTRSHRSCIWGASRFGQSPLSCSFLSSCWRCVRIFLLGCGHCSGPCARSDLAAWSFVPTRTLFTNCRPSHQMFLNGRIFTEF